MIHCDSTRDCDMNLDRLKLARRVERLLTCFGADEPGGTIGVVIDGELVIQRSRGLASLELGVAINDMSRFRIASVSKQFTCAAMLRLAAEGKLSTTDDIRLHLPELPDLGLITIDMMMRNMSGIRDMLEIQRMGGVDLSVPVTGAELLASIIRQRGTNFPPGERFLYSNSNFLLAGLIIERVSGQGLGAYLERNFFTPLGMNATKHVTSTVEVVPNLVTGYPKFDGAYIRAPHAYEIGGEGGLVSSVQDLALWDRALNEGEADLAGLIARGTFTNGETNLYARGLSIGARRGVRTEDHGGLWPGYKTSFLRAPEIGATVICMLNNGAGDAQTLAMHALDAILDGFPHVHPVPAEARDASLVGLYLDDATPMTLELSLAADGVLQCTSFGLPTPLSAREDETLIADRGPRAMALTPHDGGLTTTLASGHTQSFTWLEAPEALPDGLDGTYENPDMGATLVITGNDATLSGPIQRGRHCPLSGIKGDVFRIHTPTVLFQGWFDARAERGVDGSVHSLLVHGGRTKQVRFARV